MSGAYENAVRVIYIYIYIYIYISNSPLPSSKRLTTIKLYYVWGHKQMQVTFDYLVFSFYIIYV
jgi:hypothetical protein